MGLEIRAARTEEMDEFRKVARTSLLLPTPEVLNPELTLCAFENRELATSYAAWPLTMRVNGGDIPIAGVSMVGTLPIYRRRGYLRDITAKHFELLHSQGERPIVAIYASRVAIYQRYGYAVISTRNSYSIEPRYLEFAYSQAVPGTFREATDDDSELLAKLYDRFKTNRTGYLQRSPDMWQHGVLAPPREGGVSTKVIYEENGKSLGYLIYTAELVREVRQVLNQRLAIRDLVWLTAPAYRAVWDYLSRMDIVSNVTWGRAPSDDPLPYLLLEPRMLNIMSYDGLMGRIVDIEQALPERRYDEEGTLTFEVVDDLCSWNQGGWELEASTDGARINRTDKEPQLLMPVSTLAMLLFGQITATEAARMGRLDAIAYDSLPTWDRVMKTRYRPACADRF